MEYARGGGDQQHHIVRKRGADDAFESQSGISNHFKKLRLSKTTRPPVTLPLLLTLRYADHAPRIYEIPRPGASSEPAIDADYMPVDETPSKIYIHDLAAEIAEIEASEPRDFFLADVDKKVSAIPATLLQGSTADPAMQLVLYREPSSISVPEEEDAVRKAIVDARRRVRERQQAEREEEERGGKINGNRRFWLDEEVRANELNGGYLLHGNQSDAAEYVDVDNDPDAMEIG